MRRIVLSAWMALAGAFVWGTELPVPEKVIGEKTVAIVSLNLDEIKKDALLKSISAVAGLAPDAAAIKQFDEMDERIKAAGLLNLSFVLSIPKGSDYSTSSDHSILVIKTKEGSDNAKAAELLYSLMPDLKAEKADECPKEIDGCLVWHKKGSTLPGADKKRAEAFSGAFGQVNEHQSVSVVLMPDADAAEPVKGTLKPVEIELLSAVLDSKGICFFCNLGVTAEPGIKLLILAADAAGAEKLNKAAQNVIAQFKEDLPPMLSPLLDIFKLVQAGTHVQLSITYPEITQAAKDFMATMSPPPIGK
jgi:hypothetical protein